jgi:hypothetical protein
MMADTISSIIHVMLRIWQEDGKIQYEEEFRRVCANSELILTLPLNIGFVKLGMKSRGY